MIFQVKWGNRRRQKAKSVRRFAFAGGARNFGDVLNFLKNPFMRNDSKCTLAAKAKDKKNVLFEGTRVEALAKRAGLPQSWGKKLPAAEWSARAPRVVFGAQLLDPRVWEGEPGVFAGVVIDMQESPAFHALRAAMPEWAPDVCAQTIFEKRFWTRDLSLAAALCWAGAAGVLPERGVRESIADDSAQREEPQNGEDDDDEEGGLWECGSEEVHSRFLAAQELGLMRISHYSKESEIDSNGVVRESVIGRDSGDLSLAVRFPDEASFFWPATEDRDAEYLALTREIALKMAPGLVEAFTAMAIDMTGVSAVALSGVCETMDAFVAMMNAQSERSILAAEAKIGESTTGMKPRQSKAL